MFNNKGIATVLVVYIIALFWGISIALTAFVIKSSKMGEVNQYSEIAHYAAKSGADRGMNYLESNAISSQTRICCSGWPYSCPIKSGNCPDPTGEGKTYYEVVITPGASADRPDWVHQDSCEDTYCIDARGIYTGATPEVYRVVSRNSD